MSLFHHSATTHVPPTYTLLTRTPIPLSHTLPHIRSVLAQTKSDSSYLCYKNTIQGFPKRSNQLLRFEKIYKPSTFNNCSGFSLNTFRHWNVSARVTHTRGLLTLPVDPFPARLCTWKRSGVITWPTANSWMLLSIIISKLEELSRLWMQQSMPGSGRKLCRLYRWNIVFVCVCVCVCVCARARVSVCQIERHIEKER